MIRNKRDKTGENMPETTNFNAQLQLSTQNDTLNATLNDTFIRFIVNNKTTGKIAKKTVKYGKNIGQNSQIHDGCLAA